ncbi:helix-turn-helix domain-containing protein [Mesorhizobium sp. ESP-6-2]|uniref:helix-turn-helix domain-containing protein n=1 Tax=Mesorhizobium sp. ESP-6-2 TaxID=2876625 RepID=UPI001CCBA107|nr:helix-turn-helix domain-containing protein [Mesorhizobium sp. ESP-6-2]MBZ9810719.1 helix-turn-helix domain-containing protein [Mesorhizobium sp. ESP-6-2]
MEDFFKEEAVLVDSFDRRLRRIEDDGASILVMLQNRNSAPQSRELAYGLREVTEITGLSRSTLDKLFKEGKLHASKSGRRTLILRAELERYLQDMAE